MKPNWTDRCAWIAKQHADTIRQVGHYPGLPVRASDQRSEEALQFPHLMFMCHELMKGEMSETKACRWLGWLQAGLFARRLVTLKDCKILNLISEECADPKLYGSIRGSFHVRY